MLRPSLPFPPFEISPILDDIEFNANKPYRITGMHLYSIPK